MQLTHRAGLATPALDQWFSTFALFEFRFGSLGYSGLLLSVVVQKMLKTTAPDQLCPTQMTY